MKVTNKESEIILNFFPFWDGMKNVLNDIDYYCDIREKLCAHYRSNNDIMDLDSNDIIELCNAWLEIIDYCKEKEISLVGFPNKPGFIRYESVLGILNTKFRFEENNLQLSGYCDNKDNPIAFYFIRDTAWKMYSFQVLFWSRKSEDILDKNAYKKIQTKKLVLF